MPVYSSISTDEKIILQLKVWLYAISCHPLICLFLGGKPQTKRQSNPQYKGAITLQTRLLPIII